MEHFHKSLHRLEHLHSGGRRKPQQKPANHPDYGQDIPVFTLLFFVIGLLALVLAFGLYKLFATSQPLLAILLGTITGVIGVAGLGCGSGLIWASRSGKYQMRDKIMRDFTWRGDEQVLDVGCGRGLLLIGAARHLTTGKAVGVDIWDSNLEYDNRPENVWSNARLEGVTDRIEVKDGNAIQLPFQNDRFDLVTSSNMLHHMSKSGRSQALSEMARVLKPGGRLVIAEIAFVEQLIRVLRESGLQDVREEPLDMVLWKRVVARK